MHSLFFVLWTALLFAAPSAAQQFDYNDTSLWPPICNSGNEGRQSPIDIIPGDAIPPPGVALPIVGTLLAITATFGTFGTVNDAKVFTTPFAHETKFNSYKTLPEITIPANQYTGGSPNSPISATPIQFHFHTKSEHKINGGNFDAEMHIVCIVNNGGDLQLAVFGILLKIATSGTNPFYSALLNVEIEKAGIDNAVDYPGELNIDNFLPDNLAYYTYPGSLTTPTCDEIVTWHVFKNPVNIAADVVTKHQDLVANLEGALPAPPRNKFNARPVQPIGTREVQNVDAPVSLNRLALFFDISGIFDTVEDSLNLASDLVLGIF